MILKTMINLKGEGGWLCFPCRTQQALSNGKNLRGSVHLFFFQGGECPGVSILSEYFQRRHIIICSFPTAPRSAFKSPWSIWLAYTGGFSAYTGCSVASQMPWENLGRRRKLGMQCFHSWLKESLHWAIGKVLSWSDLIQTILCSCNNKFSSFQVIYFNYSMIPVIDFFFYIL